VTAGLHPRQFLGALCSGFALVLLFPRWDLGWLAWISLVPLLLAIRTATPGEAFRLGFVAGVIAYGGLMEWVRLFGLPAWIMLSIGMAGFLGTFAAGAVTLVRRYGRGGGGDAWLWAGPLTWVAVELIRSVGPLGFPWGLLGLTQYRTPVVLSLAPWVGVLGLGGMIALVNVVIAGAIGDVMGGRRIGAASIGAGVLVGILLVVGNAVREAPPAAMRIVAAVQPNVRPQTKGDPATVPAIIADLLKQTDDARTSGAEIIVYPETAVPIDLSAAAAVRAEIARRAGPAVVAVGTILPGPQNGVLVLGAEGRVLGRYAKRRLVPFGEAGVRPGEDAAPVQTPGGAIGLAICYESAFTDLITPIASNGADVLAVLTNDGWFGVSAGPAQHAAHAVLRAAETRRTVIRAANTGTSMLILPGGAILAAQPLGTKGVLVAAVPVGGPRTPYVRWGWLIAPLALAGWLVAAAPIGWAAVRRSKAAALRLAAVIALPGAVFLADRVLGFERQAPAALTSLVVIGLCAAMTRGRLFNRRGVLPAAAVSLTVTVLLVLAMRAAYAQYGFHLPVGPPDGRWISWLAAASVGGLAIEVWLRGAVFTAAVPLGGWPLAVALSTALGIALHLGQPQEVIFWQLFTGVLFAAIRLRTGDAVGLGPARGWGDAAMQAVVNLR
jgi:apolipoprotein N-acyltransferase